MLEILTKVDSSQGFMSLNSQGVTTLPAGPAILADASRYLQLSMADIIPGSGAGFEDLKVPFVYIPVVNQIKVPVAGVSPELKDMVPGIIAEVISSKILEDMELTVKAVNALLPDPEPVRLDFDPTGLVSHQVKGKLDYYNLDKHYQLSTRSKNPWAGTHKLRWFGQDLYMCTAPPIKRNECYVMIDNPMSDPVEEEALLIRLINYKYAFKRYGIKTISD